VVCQSRAQGRRCLKICLDNRSYRDASVEKGRHTAIPALPRVDTVCSVLDVACVRLLLVRCSQPTFLNDLARPGFEYRVGGMGESECLGPVALWEAAIYG
jgi:hypothetical protein